MNPLLSALLSVQWGTVFGIISLVVFLASVIIQVVERLRVMSPLERNVVLHAALKTALALEADAAAQGWPAGANAALDVIVGNVNVYLKLHGVPITVTAQEVKLLLMEAKLGLQTLEQHSPPAPAPTASA